MHTQSQLGSNALRSTLEPGMCLLAGGGSGCRVPLNLRNCQPESQHCLEIARSTAQSRHTNNMNTLYIHIYMNKYTYIYICVCACCCSVFVPFCPGALPRPQTPHNMLASSLPERHWKINASIICPWIYPRICKKSVDSQRNTNTHSHIDRSVKIRWPSVAVWCAGPVNVTAFFLSFLAVEHHTTSLTNIWGILRTINQPISQSITQMQETLATPWFKTLLGGWPYL